ncbi:IPTL-CTERM sorting domain-containing protein [Elongatibacter sediminis]|uniref:IPTL-CTERM sorting domain-containing protein n=1 Tax=Elongatibacter sediminis TaxID=3119006 RepID=A0AAW9R6T3_9GAMM
MNVNKITLLSALLMLFGTSVAMAQPRALVEDDVAPLGTSSINITVQYEDGANNGTGAQFEVTYNAAVMTPDLTGTCPSPGIWGCSNPSPGVLRFVSGFFPGEDLPDFSGQVAFDISSTPAGVYPLDVQNEVYSNGGGQVQPNGTDPGSITIEGPAADFTPNAGLLDLGSVQQGGSNPTANVGIDNSGASGTTLTGSCTESGDTNNAFTITGDTSFSVPAAGPNDQVTVTCDASLAPNTYTASMSCSHNGDDTGESSPAVYSLSCTVTPGPAPAYSSTPAAGSALNFGTVAKGDPDPTLDVDISNSGDPNTTLTGSCSFTNNPNNAYSLTTDGSFSVAQGAGAETETVSCDTAIPGNHNGGTLSCSHNGSNPSPATYTLNCNIPPEPAITATPNPNPLDLGPVPQNNTDPTGTLTIDNSGDPNSTLSGTCSLLDGSGPISIQSGGGGYSVPEAGPNQVVTVACDSSDLPGVYNDTLSCTHDDDNANTPANFPVTCTIGQPDPAIYASTPVSGSTLDFNAGGSVVQDDPDPTLPLQIRNDASAGDADMDVSCTLNQVMGAAISVNPAITNEIVAPGGSRNVTFTCDTETVGTYEASYGCDWSSVVVEGAEDPEGVQSFQENYTVTCEVIDAESDVDPETPSGTVHTELVEPGGSAQYSFTFNETLDQGADGELDCSLDDGAAGFTILSPSFPATVPSGGSTTVVVEGTDPGGVESTTDTLRCTYTDTSNPNGVEVFYDLVLLIGGNATFMVTKDFTDDNPGEVLVTLSCNTGLPLEQTKLITEEEYVKFIVGDFDSGEMDCTVTEDVPNGYSASYDAGGSASDYVDDDVDNPGCHFIDVDGGDDNFCAITNSPDPVDVVITKEWVFEGNSLDAGIDTRYDLTLWCDGEIVGGYDIFGDTQEAPAGDNGCGLIKMVDQAQFELIEIANWCKTFNGNGPDDFNAQVIPEYPDTNCFVYERVYDDAVEIDNGCGSITVSAGQGDACTITNTVFFEGIPTLSQYGMAILALLMLGIGMVGFRRFT